MKNRLFVSFMTVALYSLLIMSYQYSIAVGYYFSIYDDKTTFYAGSIGLIGVLFLSFLVYPDSSSSRNLAYTIFLYLLYIPSIAVSVVSGNYVYIIFLCVISASFLGLGLKYNNKKITAPKFKFTLFEIVLVCNLLLAFTILFKYRSILTFPSFSDVYTLRLQARGMTSYFYGLLLSWSKFVFAPLAILLGVYFRRVFVFSSGLLLYLSIYMSTGAKSAVFYPVILSLILICLNFVRKDRVIPLITLGAFFFAFFSFIIEFLTDVVIYPYTIERLFIAPGVLTGLYYDFFSESEKALLGYSIFSSFVSYPYSSEPSFLIGQLFFTSDTRANASFLADGFANFGFIGVIVYSIICRLLFFLYDLLAYEWPESVRVSFIIPFVLFLVNSSPLTMVITGGFFIVIIIGFLFKLEK